MSDLVHVRNLRRSFRSGDRSLDVLQGLDLDLSRGEMLAVVGASGVGKSTLLHLLGALDRPDEGSYLFDGKDVFAGSSDQLAHFRNTMIGFVFQFHHLLPEFTAHENVMIAGLIGRASPSQTRERATALLDELGVAERADHVPAQLSGGEQQRVAIARALMTAGALLLADEPTGNLDSRTATMVFEVMCGVRRARNISIVMATHNERLASRCDRVLRLNEGVLTPVSAGRADPKMLILRLSV